MKNSSRSLEERRGSALAKECLFPAKAIRSKVAQEPCEEESNLACLIRLCLEEFLVNDIISLGDDLTASIRPYVPGEIVGHWTTTPCFVVALVE